MTASAPFRITADVLERLEAEDATVRSVDGVGDDLYDDGTFGTDVRAELPFLVDLELPDRLELTVSETDIVDGGLRFTVSIRTTAPEPAYRDPERLRAVYDAHETFPAMTEALDVEVEPQTVRKHMVRAGIHEPERPPRDERGSTRAPTGSTTTEVEDGSDDDSAGSEPAGDDGDSATDASTTDPDGESSVSAVEDGDSNPDTDAVADGRGAEAGEPGTPIDGHIAAESLGLPEGVTLADLRAALEGSRTLHEVQRRTGVEREQLKRCLGNLGLLDLVIGRVSESDRTITAEEIDRRIARAIA